MNFKEALKKAIEEDKKWKESKEGKEWEELRQKHLDDIYSNYLDGEY